MVTSRDVAKLANVSQATVSRAFREDVYIDSETKKKVQEAAKELGYYPNYSARSLKNQHSGMIGLMLTDPNNTFFASLTKSIEESVSKKGYRLLLTYNNEDARKERECLESLISSRVEGALVLPVSTENSDLFDVLKGQGVGIVQMIRKLYDDIHTVTVNDELGTYVATKYLLDSGHRHILFTEYNFNEALSTKTAGYRRAFQEYGLDPNTGILDLPFGVNLEGVIAGAIAERSSTAVLASNMPITLATLKALNAHHMNIPEKISLMAYDDSEWLELLGISTISHPMQQIGETMAQIMFDSIEAIKQNQVLEQQFVQVKPYLLLRNSIRNI